MVTYLDFNATAPIEEEVLEYMNEIYRNHYGNPNSRTHIYGNMAKGIVNDARRRIADSLGIDEMEIVFTSGSTESNNIAVLGLLEYAKKTGKNHFITTAIEHKAVLEPMEYLQTQGVKVDFVKPGEDGRVKLDDVINCITDRTAMISVMHVNSETGIIQPVKEIGEYLKNKDIFFHIDATQSFGKMNKELMELKYDLLSISAHKLRGPQGVGALVLRQAKDIEQNIKPLMYGGGQERKIRPGTVPVALVAGFGKAVEICERMVSVREQNCKKIRKQFLKSINGLKYQINGANEFCIPSTINVSFEGVDAESIFVAVKQNYAISNGAACISSGKYKDSYVLEAMGLDSKRRSEAIRISWDYDTEVDFEKLVEHINGQQEE